jgi:Spy/CpxP family protein refolding chaperone
MKRVIGVLLVALLSMQAIGQELSERKPEGTERTRQRSTRSAHRRHQDGMGMGLRRPEVAAKVGLSESQRDAIETQMVMLEKQNRQLKQKMDKAAMHQAKLMTAETLDEAALMKAVETIGRLHTKRAKLRMKHLIFMRQTLTPEQTQVLRKLMRERRAGPGGNSPRRNGEERVRKRTGGRRDGGEGKSD